MHDIDRATRLPDGDFRSESEHDRDRILYSPEFRRLAGITQVITPREVIQLTIDSLIR